MNNWDWVSFGQDVLSTAVGAVLGFGFALLLAKIQRDDEKAKALLSEQNDNETALSQGIQSCAVNIESLLNFKQQLVLGAISDRETLRPLIEPGSFETALGVVGQLPHIFLTLPTVSQLPPPPSTEFRFAVKAAPMLTAFLHRATGITASLNDFVLQQNRLLHEQARANGRGMTMQEHIYFWRMITSGVDVIAQSVDDALFFWHISYDQLRYLQRFKYPGSKLRLFLNAGKAALMPASTHVANYRNQIKTFGLPVESLEPEVQVTVKASKVD